MSDLYFRLIRRREVTLSTAIILSAFSCAGLFGCEDESPRDGGDPTFTTEARHYVFPAPNFESQSSSVTFSLENRGGSPLRIRDVTYVEMDDTPEIRLLMKMTEVRINPHLTSKLAKSVQLERR